MNPRLGTYFGIFLGAFAALVLVVLILEGLGVEPNLTSLTMLIGPIVMFAAIGVATRTNDALDFFAAGRRVPAFFNGLTLAMAAFGATGFVALTGLFFIIGFDALFISIGVLSGFVIMAVLLAPFLRKFGAFTIPSYLGRRFDSRALRILAALLLIFPILMVLAAELKFIVMAASSLSGWPSTNIILLVTLTLLLTLLPGGMRSATWTSTAQAMAALIALIVPVAIVAIILTNLPVPQLTHGPVLRAIGRSEAVQGLPIILPPALAMDIPGQELQPIAKRFANALGAVGSLAFSLSTLTILAGVASAPWLLPRLASTPGVYEARKSLGWATFLFGVAILTAASVAVFMRDYLLKLAAASGPTIVPAWLGDLAKRGLASISTSGTEIQVSSINFARDGVVFSLPISAELPNIMLDLTLAGAIAAGLAAASASATALGHILGEDIAYGMTWEPPAGERRLAVARGGITLSILAGAVIATTSSADPLRMFLWALALSGAALFPVLVLSIWWKRINAFGAFAGVATGFSVTGLAIIGCETGTLGIDSALAAVLGIPAGTTSAIAVTLATPAPSRHQLEFVRDIRVPGGEILYDRETRLLRLKRQRQSS